jgi:glyoxylase-like metal-dependent hydrolase (beta-lactamase superfamily II)
MRVLDLLVNSDISNLVVAGARTQPEGIHAPFRVVDYDNVEGMVKAFNGVELLKHFLDAKIYARPLIIKENEFDFRARQLHWTGVFNVGAFEGEIPENLFDMLPIEGDSYDLDGHEIQFIDLKPAETVYATGFYIPETKSYIAGDQLYNKCHYYIGAGLNRPELWIESIEDVRNKLDIEVVIPGHGYVGGTEIFDEAMSI